MRIRSLLSEQCIPFSVKMYNIYKFNKELILSQFKYYGFGGNYYCSKNCNT